MKLEPLFQVKENKLYKIADNSPVDFSTVKFIEIQWTTVEIDDDVYNEEFLAFFRDELKKLETLNQFVILVPVVDKALTTELNKEAFINTYNHTARRIKDCENVIGFLLPEEILSEGLNEGSFAADFMETIAKKHAQYVNLIKNEVAESLNLSNQIQNSAVVLY